ncbi:hypothetical protein CC86DRAFT_388611 [Ophiobolus disseminans]|uniref:Uncharacterized protein n=1 Tax=Ophiobolus disseminans TaxID=1469910 RepID=A0A6A6ZD04_9PLEO|nr:hypothetical protein CC86DRAFT_388611 [Ophiobolus disseminans]
MSSVREVQRSQNDLGIRHESQLNRILGDILDLTQAHDEKIEVRIADQVAQLESLKTKLDVLMDDHKTSTRNVMVVRSLYFPEVRRRFEQILLRHQRSNEWIYDPASTDFDLWLESKVCNDSVFYIYGKAGSGKSTLMKYVAECSRTRDSLKVWAGSAKLYISSYFFWNQGNEMQKSRTGLIQSLLYQILRAAPELIPSNCGDRLEHEAWDLEHLMAMFEHIATRTELDSKFCFFIDGLDEYNGDESDIIPLLRVLSASSHIKICASSRPGRIYETELRNNRRAFDIAHHTKEDMRKYVSTWLTTSKKFQRLASSEPKCKSIITEISEYADGVWLWVYLVTRDIIYEVERDEGIVTLLKIINDFPSDLEQYFQRIIERIKDRHKEEMAQTFLVTVHEVQPLPLYAFALLEKERTYPDYALQAPIESVQDAALEQLYPTWKSRVQNRCGDLLVVDESAHPVFLSHSVDFLHRTVRDFLRDCYHDQLKSYLRADFSPLLSLCKVCLALLKALTINDFRDRESLHQIIGLTDELLYYAHEFERTGESKEHATLMAMLDEVDTVNSHHSRKIKNHWTHARDSPAPRGHDVYREGGNCTFIALAIQARLVKYVGAKLQSDPKLLPGKRGRPLLDYALRPRRATPISLDYHSTRDEPSIDVDMVQLLLTHGADPNQPVQQGYNGETVWALFLLSIYEANKQDSIGTPTPPSVLNAWYRACEALIMAGAQADRKSLFVTDRGLTTSDIFWSIFSATEVSKLQEQIEIQAKERDESQSSCVMM